MAEDIPRVAEFKEGARLRSSAEVKESFVDE